MKVELCRSFFYTCFKERLFWTWFPAFIAIPILRHVHVRDIRCGDRHRIRDKDEGVSQSFLFLLNYKSVKRMLGLFFLIQIYVFGDFLNYIHILVRLYQEK